MSRTAKIAGGAALAGLMMAVAILSVRDRTEIVAVPDETAARVIDAPREDLSRCRTLTMPDSGCEAAWEAKRRHFFRRDLPK